MAMPAYQAAFSRALRKKDLSEEELDKILAQTAKDWRQDAGGLTCWVLPIKLGEEQFEELVEECFTDCDFYRDGPNAYLAGGGLLSDILLDGLLPAEEEQSTKESMMLRSLLNCDELSSSLSLIKRTPAALKIQLLPLSEDAVGVRPKDLGALTQENLLYLTDPDQSCILAFVVWPKTTKLIEKIAKSLLETVDSDMTCASKEPEDMDDEEMMCRIYLWKTLFDYLLEEGIKHDESSKLLHKTIADIVQRVIATDPGSSARCLVYPLLPLVEQHSSHLIQPLGKILLTDPVSFYQGRSSFQLYDQANTKTMQILASIIADIGWDCVGSSVLELVRQGNESGLGAIYELLPLIGPGKDYFQPILQSLTQRLIELRSARAFERFVVHCRSSCDHSKPVENSLKRAIVDIFEELVTLLSVGNIAVIFRELREWGLSVETELLNAVRRRILSSSDASKVEVMLFVELGAITEFATRLNDCSLPCICSIAETVWSMFRSKSEPLTREEKEFFVDLFRRMNDLSSLRLNAKTTIRSISECAPSITVLIDALVWGIDTMDATWSVVLRNFVHGIASHHDKNKIFEKCIKKKREWAAFISVEPMQLLIGREVEHLAKSPNEMPSPDKLFAVPGYPEVESALRVWATHIWLRNTLFVCKVKVPCGNAIEAAEKLQKMLGTRAVCTPKKKPNRVNINATPNLVAAAKAVFSLEDYTRSLLRSLLEKNDQKKDGDGVEMSEKATLASKKRQAPNLITPVIATKARTAPEVEEGEVL